MVPQHPTITPIKKKNSCLTINKVAKAINFLLIWRPYCPVNLTTSLEIKVCKITPAAEYSRDKKDACNCVFLF